MMAAKTADTKLVFPALMEDSPSRGGWGDGVEN